MYFCALRQARASFGAAAKSVVIGPGVGEVLGINARFSNSSRVRPIVPSLHRDLKFLLDHPRRRLRHARRRTWPLARRKAPRPQRLPAGPPALTQLQHRPAGLDCYHVAPVVAAEEEDEPHAAGELRMDRLDGPGVAIRLDVEA